MLIPDSTNCLAVVLLKIGSEASRCLLLDLRWIHLVRDVMGVMQIQVCFILICFRFHKASPHDSYFFPYHPPSPLNRSIHSFSPQTLPCDFTTFRCVYLTSP